MPLTPTIFAFGLASPLALWWLAAAAAPIVIHLLSRRRYRETSWAAMEYLLAALRRQSRRLQLERWLLLAIRVLIVALLVLAVAEPFFERIGFAPAAAGKTHRVLVIDGSYSMGYKSDDKSRFERAKELARQIVEQSSQGDAFTLVLMSSPPREVVGTPALEPGEVLAEIDNLRLAYTTADLPGTVDLVRKIVEGAGRENAHLSRHEVYFLTDLQRVGWVPELSDAAMAEFRRRSRQLARSATLVVIDLGGPDAENLALSGLRALEPVVTLDQNVELEVELKNFGRLARSGQVVDLMVDQRRVARQVVEIPPDGAVSVAFSHRFPTPGDHTVEVRADGDALDVDNRRPMAVPVRKSIRVLCVNGRPSGEPLRGATDYLALGLWPWRDDAGSARIRPEVVPESAILELDLNRYDCVFLCSVAQFTSSEARVLNDYLKSGGSLVFFLGEGVLADRYNRELAGERPGGVRLLPARLGPIVAGNRHRLDPLGYRHPIASEFRDHERAGLLSAPVQKYFKLIVPKDSKANVALALAGGDPLIVEQPVGRGRVVLVATSADASWASMAIWPSYPAIVQEILLFAIAGQLRQRNVEVGQPLGASISTPAAGVLVSVQRPDGSSQRVQLRREGDYSQWTYADTTSSGIYRVRFGPPLSSGQTFAVNVNTVESDLTQLDEAQLRQQIWAGVPLVYQTTWQNPKGQLAGPIRRPGQLHVALLYAVLGLLLLETFLAWRFGYQTT